jgi:hypothetical protein
MSTMRNVTRREVMQLVGTTGTAVVAAAAATAADPAAQKLKTNSEPPVDSRARPDSYGPRELFAVVDMEGNLRRGLHAVSSRRLDVGVYEVIFNRDVRRGVYLATIGGHGYAGSPLAAIAAVMGRATEPRGVTVYTSSLTGDQLDSGFHLLVVCPEGHA